jgi:hypothetical protein
MYNSPFKPKFSSAPIEEVLLWIISESESIWSFWRDSSGWAPSAVATLLKSAKLDRHASLAHCLQFWLTDFDPEMKDGALILAWANLGSLLEGTMKFFLAVHLEDFQAAPRHLRKNLDEPDKLILEALRIFFKEEILSSEEKTDWTDWILLIQQRRNSIHAFQERDIGDFAEFYESVRMYAVFLDHLQSRVPYP